MRSWTEIKKDANLAMRMNWGSAIGVFIIVGIINYAISKLSESIPYLGLLSFLFTIPLGAGYCYYFLCVYRRQNPTLATVFKSGFSDYGRILGGVLYRNLFLALWSLIALIPIFTFPLIFGSVITFNNYASFYAFQLRYEGIVALLVFLAIIVFMIPAIIKGLAYFAVPYLLLDHPDVKATKAIGLSKRITEGHKGKIFAMQLSFVGPPIGILILYVMLIVLVPYAILGFSIFILLFELFYLLYFGPYMEVSFAGLYEEMKRYALSTGVITPYDLEKPAPPFEQPYPPQNPQS